MKHIKLFESFGQGQGPFLIGYYGEGGIGSHPAIFTREYLEGLQWSNKVFGHWYGPNSYQSFDTLEETPTLPEALICGFSPDVEWDIKPISDPSMIRKISEILGQFGEIDPLMRNEDYIEENDLVYDKEEQEKISNLIGEISNMTGVLGKAKPGERSVTLVYVSSPNTIYWSDEPERTHGYWKPPYDEISVEDHSDFDDVFEDGDQY